MEENITASYLAARKGVIDRFFNRMNPRQKEALFAMDGPVLILAGAGSGKTTVMVNRIANMIRFGDAHNSNSMPLAVTEQDVSFLEACQRAPFPSRTRRFLWSGGGRCRPRTFSLSPLQTKPPTNCVTGLPPCWERRAMVS